VAQRDARVVPVLVRILDESDPFGGDHAIVLETLDALTSIAADDTAAAQSGPGAAAPTPTGRSAGAADQAVTALAALMRKKKLLARKKVRAVREKSVAVLRALKTPGAARALDEAARNGDRMLRRLARADA
jgi:hypothetical protein